MAKARCILNAFRVVVRPNLATELSVAQPLGHLRHLVLGVSPITGGGASLGAHSFRYTVNLIGLGSSSGLGLLSRRPVWEAPVMHAGRRTERTESKRSEPP
jgi:hypothetical protein